ncbi:MAG TPA: hypothetical protein VHT91_32610 [Kofleriaceae bacterium]|nr:hypothetical protein [Kofleriaceae bacterium]
MADDDVAASQDPAGQALQKRMPVKPPDQPGLVGEEIPVKSGLQPAADVLPVVSLVASVPSPWPMTYTVLTARTNIDVGSTPYYIRIFDAETGTYLANCRTGSSCSVSVTRPNVDLTSFTAVISDLVNPPVASMSTQVYWHVSGVKLTPSVTTLAVGATATLTATTDYDISSSPFWVQLYDDTTATLLKSCGGGTQCSATVGQTTATTHAYRACFSGFGAAMPPPNLLECTAERFIAWSSTGISVVLSVSQGAVTAFASVDVGPTPYFIQIFDFAGSRLAACGSGRSCSAAFNATWSGSYLVAVVGPSVTAPDATATSVSSVITAFGIGDGAQGTVVGVGPHPSGPPGLPPFAVAPPVIH